MISYGQNSSFQKTIDSIKTLRHLASKETDLNTRLEYAERAANLSLKTNVDSTLLKSNEILSKLYWETNKNEAYRDINKQNIALAVKIKDSSALGQAHLNLGEYYRKRSKYGDSAFNYYHKAEKIYQNLALKFQRCEALFGMAVIQCFEKDYIQSEVTSFNALNLLESLNQSNDIKKLKSFIYNNLGLVYGQLYLFEDSINYYSKSIKLKKKLKGNFEKNISNSINNLGFLYKEIGKYDLAIDNFKKILQNCYIKKVHKSIYLMSLENYAHTLFLSGDFDQLPQLYHKVLKIADTSNVVYETITAHQHLAEYYHYFKQKDSAKHYAYKALEISKNYYNDDILKSLKVLSKVEDDSIAVKHYADYIKLNDSIQKNERLTRNKFARIQFETDNYIEKTKKLSSQNVLISIIIAIIVFVLVLLYIVRIQIGKNQKLVFANKQQKANEQIYTLIMNQQAKVEETRLTERYTVSEQLNNGILNKLTGSRFGLEILSMSEKPLNKEAYKDYVAELQHLEKEIRDISHSLKKTSFNDDTTFISLIEDYLEKQNDISNFKYDVNLINQINWQDINDDLKIAIFKIIQEVAYGIIKHKNANTLTLNFSEEITRKLRLEIITNLDFSAKRAQKKRRLKNIKHIVSKLKGTYTMERDQNKHLCIELELPITPKPR